MGGKGVSEIQSQASIKRKNTFLSALQGQVTKRNKKKGPGERRGKSRSCVLSPSLGVGTAPPTAGRSDLPPPAPSSESG